eukprot:scaffold15729_cov62-Phaeocystis_antarctica.AAC.3
MDQCQLLLYTCCSPPLPTLDTPSAFAAQRTSPADKSRSRIMLYERAREKDSSPTHLPFHVPRHNQSATLARRRGVSALEIVSGDSLWRRQFEWRLAPQTVTSATSERESQGCPERTHRKELDAEIEAQVVGHKTLQIGRFIRQRPKQD